jgi:hypothetical protein
MMPRALAGDPHGLVVVDWSMLVRKAWHVSGVEEVASIVLGRIWRLLSDPMPPSMAIAVDPERVDPETGTAVRRRTWRDRATEHLPEKQRYKAGRIPKPPELVAIERRMFYVMRALRIPFLLPANPAEEQAYDADDAIGAAVKRCREEGRSVAILTEDKDLLQCVTADDDPGPRVIRWWPFLSGQQRDAGEAEEYDAAAVMRKLSVEPKQVTDYLAIMGDSGDNVPGVPGIGPKGAARILFDHGDLETALTREPETRPERLLHEHRDAARASRSICPRFARLFAASDSPAWPTNCRHSQRRHLTACAPHRAPLRRRLARPHLSLSAIALHTPKDMP